MMYRVISEQLAITQRRLAAGQIDVFYDGAPDRLYTTGADFFGIAHGEVKAWTQLMYQLNNGLIGTVPFPMGGFPQLARLMGFLGFNEQEVMFFKNEIDHNAKFKYVDFDELLIRREGVFISMEARGEKCRKGDAPAFVATNMTFNSQPRPIDLDFTNIFAVDKDRLRWDFVLDNPLHILSQIIGAAKRRDKIVVTAEGLKLTTAQAGVFSLFIMAAFNSVASMEYTDKAGRNVAGDFFTKNQLLGVSPTQGKFINMRVAQMFSRAATAIAKGAVVGYELDFTSSVFALNVMVVHDQYKRSFRPFYSTPDLNRGWKLSPEGRLGMQQTMKNMDTELFPGQRRIISKSPELASLYTFFRMKDTPLSDKTRKGDITHAYQDAIGEDDTLTQDGVPVLGAILGWLNTYHDLTLQNVWVTELIDLRHGRIIVRSEADFTKALARLREDGELEPCEEEITQDTAVFQSLLNRLLTTPYSGVIKRKDGQAFTLPEKVWKDLARGNPRAIEKDSQGELRTMVAESTNVKEIHFTQRPFSMMGEMFGFTAQGKR